MTPAECAIKVQAAINSDAQVIGYTSGAKAYLSKVSGGTFRTVLRARFEATQEGSTIQLIDGMDPIVFTFSCIFIGAFLVLAIIFIVAALKVFQSFQLPLSDWGSWLYMLSPLLIAAMMFGFIRFARYQARNERAPLIRLVVDAADAKGRSAGPRAVGAS